MYFALFLLVGIFQLFSMPLDCALTLSMAGIDNDQVLKRQHSPGLSWSEPLKQTQSYVLVLRKDAFVYWIVYNIPNTTFQLTEGIGHSQILPDGSYQGMNSFGHIGYDGPAAPSRGHPYELLLYALDIKPSIPPGATFDKIQIEMKGHILQSARLTGLEPERIPGVHPTAPNPVIHSKTRS